MRIPSLLTAAALASLMLHGCSDAVPGAEDAAGLDVDSGLDGAAPVVDGGLDASLDGSSLDAGPDAGPDGSLDGSVNWGMDGSTDAGGSDAAAPVDAGGSDAAAPVDGGNLCSIANGGCDVLTTCEVVAGVAVCGACPDGYLGSGESGCTPWTECVAGEYVSAEGSASSDRVCTACDAGSYSAETNAALCTPWTECTPGEYVSASGGATVDRSCASCAPGTETTVSNASECARVLCGANERVDTNMCVACPSGTTNAAGDDASGSDTSCDLDACSAAVGVDCATFAEGYLKASNTDPGDAFGYAVAIDGDTLVVGAPTEDSPATGVNGSEVGNSLGASGAVYVFVRVGATWTQQAYIKASNTGRDDWFGMEVALSGDTLAIGARFEDSWASSVNGDGTNDSATDSGAVYVFRRSGTTWSQEAYIKPSNTDPYDYFGYALALEGDTLAVGAIGEDSNATGVGGNRGNNGASAAGAVFIFTRSSTTWSQRAYIKASNTDASDQFGSALALSGNILAVGAPYEDSNATGVGGSQADNSAIYAGAVYVFRGSGSSWTQEAYIKASNTGNYDYFGEALALSGDTLAVGAPDEDSNATGVGGDGTNNSAGQSGAVYVFTRVGTSWSQQAYVKASNTGADDAFGSTVALSGDTLAVGAPHEESNATGVNGNEADNTASASGALYLFSRSGGTWTQDAYVKASNTEESDYFAYALALSGDTLAVGARYEDSSATGVGGDQSDNSASGSGAVYVRRIAP